MDDRDKIPQIQETSQPSFLTSSLKMLYLIILHKEIVFLKGETAESYQIINLLRAPIQFSSVAQLCPTLWDPMDCSTPGFPVHHHLLVLA